MASTRWTLPLLLLLAGCFPKPVVELHSARITAPAPTGVAMTVRIRVNNRNSFDVKVRNVRAQVTIAERYALPYVRYDPDRWMPANSWTVVEVPVLIPWPTIAPLVATTVGSDTVGYRVVGYADVTAVRMLGVQVNDYELDEEGSVTRLELIAAAGRGMMR